MRKKTRFGFGLIASITVVSTLAAWAHSSGVFAQPTAVAVVDFDVLQRDLDEQAALFVRLTEKFQPMADEITQMDTQMQAMVNRLNEDGPTMTDEEKRELTLEGMLLENRIRSSNEILQLAQTAEAHAVMQDLYPKIYAGIATIAVRDGWDIVMLDTSKIDPSKAQNLETMNNAVSRRTILYVNPNVDITAEVVILLNNNFANPPKPPVAVP